MKPTLIGLLGIAFVVLKLCGVIAWSWWWVTMPFWAWMPAAAIAGALQIVFRCGTTKRRKSK